MNTEIRPCPLQYVVEQLQYPYPILLSQVSDSDDKQDRSTYEKTEGKKEMKRPLHKFNNSYWSISISQYCVKIYIKKKIKKKKSAFPLLKFPKFSLRLTMLDINSIDSFLSAEFFITITVFQLSI